MDVCPRLMLAARAAPLRGRVDLVPLAVSKPERGTPLPYPILRGRKSFVPMPSAASSARSDARTPHMIPVYYNSHPLFVCHTVSGLYTSPSRSFVSASALMPAWLTPHEVVVCSMEIASDMSCKSLFHNACQCPSSLPHVEP